MATVQNNFNAFVPKAIEHGNSLYQEHLRGTAKEELFASLAARICAYVPEAITPYLQKKVYDSQVVPIALSILFFMGLRFYGVSRGYNVNFTFEMVTLAYSPKVHNFIYLITTPKKQVKNYQGRVTHEIPNPGARTENQKRTAALLHIIVSIATVCLFYKFQSNRNPSLSLNPYLYFGIGISLIGSLKNYNFDQQINTFLSKKTSYYAQVNSVASRILILFFVAQAVKLATGQGIQMAWKWEILSTVATSAARTYLPIY